MVIYLDNASIHAWIAKELGYDPDRITVYKNSGTVGPYIQASYVPPQIKEHQPVLIDYDMDVAFSYFGLSGVIHTWAYHDDVMKKLWGEGNFEQKNNREYKIRAD